MSKPRPRPVDMSVQPEQRRRRRPGRVVATPPAQLSHGTNPRAVRQRRDGERWLAVQERLREDAANCVECGIGVTDSRPGDFPVRPGKDEAVLHLDNLVIVSRELNCTFGQEAG